MRLAALLLTLVMLGGCAERLGEYGRQGVEEKRAYNDLKARGLMTALCDISLGAFYRELEPAEQCLVTQACGGSCASLGAQPPSAVFMIGPGNVTPTP